MNSKLLATIIAIMSCWACSASLAATVTSEQEYVNGTTAGTTVSTSNYPLFFVTDRCPLERGGRTEFGSERSKELVFGEYIRDEHSNSSKNSKRILFQSERQFLDALTALGKTNIAVFVHGYKQSFDDSMDRGLLMAEHLNAPLLVFSWPSKNNYCRYMHDECAAEWSSQHLAKILDDLGQSFGFANVTIVAHSLGARIVQWSLKDLYLKHRPSDRFAAILFFAPDVDRDTFLQNAPFLKQACSSCRLFFDRHDSRIWVSKLLHGSPRIGTSDKDGTQAKLSEIFQFDMGMRSHDSIPFHLIAASMRQVAVAAPNE